MQPRDCVCLTHLSRDSTEDLWVGHRASATAIVCPQVVVPTRVGQGYVYEASQAEQDEYDTPRHLLAPGPQDIYDVPPVRGLLPNQYGQEVSVRDQRRGRGQRLGLALGNAFSQPSQGLGSTAARA